MTLDAAPSLIDVLLHHADDPHLLDRLPTPTTEREFHLVEQTEHQQVWLISWPPGSSTGWHDHGSAVGAYTVLRGRLREHNWQGALKLADVGTSTVRVVNAGHVHDVRNRTSEPALSLHIYSPSLDAMNRYAFLGDRIQLFSAGPGR